MTADRNIKGKIPTPKKRVSPNIFFVAEPEWFGLTKNCSTSEIKFDHELSDETYINLILRV